MRRDVLQLNADGRPLEILTIEQAVCLVLDNKAIPMVEECYAVKGASQTVQVPTVIQTTFYVRVPPREMSWSKRGVILRDDFVCAYCGNKLKFKTATVDHVIPKAQGGKDIWTNTVCACFRCNQKKGNKTPKQAGMPLLFQPKKPKFKYHVPRSAMRPEWTPFL